MSDLAGDASDGIDASSQNAVQSTTADRFSCHLQIVHNLPTSLLHTFSNIHRVHMSHMHMTEKERLSPKNVLTHMMPIILEVDNILDIPTFNLIYSLICVAIIVYLYI